ncbi:MAG: PAS domain S-box protein [Bacteroidota bacterium]
MLLPTLKKIRQFYRSMGLVEQSQVVASTAVVVSMVTIVTAHYVTQQVLGWLDFISLITVGIIGFTSVTFSLKYGRQLEDQRRELQSLNNITEAVNHSVELNFVLQSALNKVMELMNAEFGWIYLLEGTQLILHRQAGTTAKLFLPNNSISDDTLVWIHEPVLQKAESDLIKRCTTNEFHETGIRILSSIPLERQGIFAGVMIIGSSEPRRFESKKITLLQAFGNQISMALHNASLFEQVKQSEQLYADLYEHSPDMYHSIDRHGIIQRCNLTESIVLGYPKEELVGRPVLKIYPPSQHDKVRENLRKIFEEGKELRGIEEQVQHKDGFLIDVNVNTSLIYNSDGKPIVARMVFRDITEKKKFETQILQAQKIDSIGNLAGGIAHDFNNILTSILGSASIMRRRIKDDLRYSKYVELIETASRRGAALTRQLLTFARKTNPHVRLVDMNHVIDETIRLIEATTPKSIIIKKSLSPEPAFINADEGQLQQAIMNLSLNARDAMPNGGDLYISCKTMYIDDEHVGNIPDGKPGKYVVMTLADTGVGIPQHYINRIFEPFFTTKDEGKGTGLGLAVVYGVVRSHHGYISVESEVNNGTIFTIYLPRATEGISTQITQRKVPIIGGNEKILLVEDELSVSEIGSDILKELGYEVQIAPNGKEAIHIISQLPNAFHLVILDMNMPQMGGKAAFEIIKEQFPHLKVLICSGYSAQVLEDSKFLHTVEGYLQKPYGVEDLASNIRSILDTSMN